ncbi:hypothetical protein SAMN06297382_0636 [Amphiplicatus metriothermophilus]|uniref:YlxR domain-containing protein n=1 Tax=Amphiplicatus metriothermophilus TaxID=1519374 RepID=A0A239PKQ9_9PROT|nr:hypothetical protein SAMN06297382_0636 [Amphiplicatus metriothermophilus]
MTKPPEGRAKERARTCIASGEARSPETMIRFVLDPQGRVTPDLAGDLPGRGAWTSARREAIVKAAAKGLFARAFRRPAVLPDGQGPEDFAAAIEAGLEARLLAALGLARRAGALAVGFDQARAALKEGRAAALATATDAGEDGAEKLARLARGLPVLRAFDAAAQSAALGKDGVVYAALLSGPAAARVLREARRLDGFRPVLCVATQDAPAP